MEPERSDMSKTLANLVRKGMRKAFGVIFYTPRVNKDGNVVAPLPIITNMNQRIIEAGLAPPWILTRKECLAFWSQIDNDPKWGGNRPSYYAAKSRGVIDFLHSFWSPHVTKSNVILELGSNCGANLNYLMQLGYENLQGIELNRHAIQEMFARFPALASKASVVIGSLEEELTKISVGSVDVVFSMAVLIHVHPSSWPVLEEIVRVARKYICVVEAETANCSYLFARNYRRVFERLGCMEIKSEVITKESHPSINRDYDGYTARLFQSPINYGPALFP
jgi:SAM-dependent methyltransferase